ncbi:MAG: hypothetical protein P9M08_00575 [Candidatus Erginobacter occultus]|nr:hypothetical protein [Candidatus Erginobacter occultus]
MIPRIIIAVLIALPASAEVFSPAAAVGVGIVSGVDYQERVFDSSGMEYDARQLQFFLQPQVTLGKGWRIFARVGYSNLTYDTPSEGGKDYNEWGYSWGGGIGWDPFRWSGLYLGTEAGFFLTRTSGSSREGEYLNWGVDLRAGWDLGAIDICLGAAYDDGIVRDRNREDSSRDDYRLEDPWNLFAGAKLNVPFLPRLQARYYFWKDRLAFLGLGYEF